MREMKTKIIAIALGLIVAFAAGRYSVQVPPAVEQTVVIDETTDVKENKKKETVIVKDPNGKETTTIKEETNTDITKRKEARIDTKVTPVARRTLVVSGLVGTDIRHLSAIYGVAVTKEGLGPVSVGAWGLNNGIVGVSVGVSF